MTKLIIEVSSRVVDFLLAKFGDVANLVTVGDEVVGDDAPVAAPPHGLAAHDGHAQSFRLLGQQLGQPGPEVL